MSPAQLPGQGRHAPREQRFVKPVVAFEDAGDVTKLSVTHEGFPPGSPLLEAVSGRTEQTGGWPELGTRVSFHFDCLESFRITL